MFKNYYLKNPESIFFKYEFCLKSYLSDNEILNTNDNNLYVYFPVKYNFKYNLNQGFGKIYLNEYIYEKVYRKKKLDFFYNEKKFIKCVKYIDEHSESFLELSVDFKNYHIINEELTKEYKFITVIYESESLTKYLKELGFENFIVWYELTKVERKKIHTYGDYISKLKEIEFNVNNLKDYKKPKLLLHSCCGPCSTYCLEVLSKYFDITILYYNPNIIPESEYIYRLNEQKKLINLCKLGIKVETIIYDHNDFLDSIKGLNDYSEGGERCFSCYNFRLEKTAIYGKENNFDYFSTTLSISPYKNSEKLNELGIKLEEKYNINFLYSNFKLNDGYKKSIELSKKYDLYRQDYCGCEFSLNFHK